MNTKLWKSLLALSFIYLGLSCTLHYMVFPEPEPPEDLFPRAGERVVNQSAGEEILFLKDRFSGDPNKVTIQVDLRAGGSVPNAHVHGSMNEVFIGLKGEASLALYESKHTLRPRTRALVPAGAAHLPANPGDKPARFQVEMEPIGVFDLCLVQIHNLMDKPKENRNWITEQMQLARMATFCDVYRGELPVWIQKAGLFFMDPTLRAMGFPRWRTKAKAAAPP